MINDWIRNTYILEIYSKQTMCYIGDSYKCKEIYQTQEKTHGWTHKETLQESKTDFVCGG